MNSLRYFLFMFNVCTVRSALITSLICEKRYVCFVQKWQSQILRLPSASYWVTFYYCKTIPLEHNETKSFFHLSFTPRRYRPIMMFITCYKYRAHSAHRIIAKTSPLKYSNLLL